MPFGQLVTGPPGSGKSTYCHGLQQFLRAIGRNPILVNLDPANDQMDYECDIDICDLVSLSEIMEVQNLGPNGALLRSLEVLEGRFAWLEGRLLEFPDGYFVFDLPGQVEVTTCHDSLLHILNKLDKLQFQLAIVHLSDAACCTEPTKYMSMLIVALKTMMQLERPQINVLSKLRIDFRLEYYTEVQDLSYLLTQLDEDRIGKGMAKLSQALSELIQDIGLLSFIPLAVEDKECMAYLLGEIDKANGYAFGALTTGNEAIFETANSAERKEALIEMVSERYIAPIDDT